MNSQTISWITVSHFPAIHRQAVSLALSVSLFGLAAGPILAAEHAPSPPAGGLLLVCNKGDRTLSIVDPVNNVQIAAVAENGITGHEAAASLDGKRAFVPVYGNSGVGSPGTDGRLLRVIDLGKREIVGTIDFGRGVRPHCAVMNPKDGLLYVTTELSDSITVIDPGSLQIVGTVPTGQPESHMLAITHDGRRGYTANVGPGTVSVLDLAARKLDKVIPICQTTQRIALSPDDRWAFTADQTKPRLAVIDTKSNEIKRWIPLPSVGYGTAPTPDGRWLLVAMPGSSAVGVIDLRPMRLARQLSVPRRPQEVLVRPDGKIAYVSCDASREVAAIDLAEWKLDALIKTGRGTDGLAWAAGQ
jgi:YVTN family beta-propeller protein